MNLYRVKQYRAKIYTVPPLSFWEAIRQVHQEELRMSRAEKVARFARWWKAINNKQGEG